MDVPMSITVIRNLELPLRNLGFAEKEAKVYLALLELGPSSVREISLKSGLKTPTTYVILDELMQKAAVLFVPGAKKKLYSAKDPDDIFDAAKKRLNQALQDLPTLKNLGRKNSQKTIVTYYDGAAGYEQAMRYKEHETVEAGEIDCYLATSQQASPAMLASLEDYAERLRRNKVKIRGFAPEHETLKPFRADDATYYRDIKVLPMQMYSANSSIEISQTFVRFTLFDQDMLVIIENPEIAKVMRQIFEMNWGNVGFYQKMLGSTGRKPEQESREKPVEPTVFPNIA